MTSRWLAARFGRRAFGDDAELVIQMLAARAQARLDAQLRDSDALDLKALGLLGADAAALGVLIAVHDGVNRFWWLAASGLGVAGFLLLVTIWPRKLDTGPSWRTFYERCGSGSALHVGRQMLTELLEAIDANDQKTRTIKPTTVFKLSLFLMALSLPGAVLIALVR